MAKKKGTFSSNKTVGLNFEGMTELLDKIADAGGKIEPAIVKAINAGSKPIESDLMNFMRKHSKPVSKISTGATIGSFQNVAKVTGPEGAGRLFYKLGFDIKKGGLPALFLDIGTPKINPSFFVYYAINKNLDNVKAEQEKALREAFKELL